MSASSHPQPEIIGTEELKTEAKWLKLERIKWKDQEGKERFWEVANRKTRGKSGVDSVHILALLHHPSKPVSTIIIEQYRPPIGKTVIEFPAGLIDEGEDAATAALRELHEETGYGSGKAGDGNAEVGEVSPVLAKDPGMTGANMNLGEHIVKRVIPLQHLYATLQDYDKNGFAIDALVASVAEGWKLARTFANSS
ncbi:hypothetical protein JCM24511_00953 [Saitozyma sp. JCM 24511]|nr:hypothetical protein JCM24511_00953 [Saitozyma sp. JCM 24511]